MIGRIKWFVSLYSTLKILQVCQFLELDESVFTLFQGQSICEKCCFTDVHCPVNSGSLLCAPAICAPWFVMSWNCGIIFSSWQSTSMPVLKSWRIHLHTFWCPPVCQKSLFDTLFSWNFPSAYFRKFAKCAPWFVMIPNHRIILSSWQRTYIPVFRSPSDQWPSFITPNPSPVYVF